MIETRLGVDGWRRVGDGPDGGLGFKEVTWCDEHQVFYVSAESLNSTPPPKKILHCM